MSQSLTDFSLPSSNFQSVLNAALDAYEIKTKYKLLTHPLAAQLQSCDSPTAILSIFQELVQRFDQRRRSDERLTNWLHPTVTVLYSFSAALGEGIGLLFSPAKVIFAGIGVLLLAVKDVDASQDVLIDLFEHIENFFKRLEFYAEVPPTAAMTDMVMKIMVEVLSILATATREIQQSRPRKYLRRLVGKNDLEDALKRLDKLTQEEARMETAETLKVMHRVDNNMGEVIEDGKEAKAIMQRMDEEKRKQLRQDLRGWLSAPDPSTNHNVARSFQHEGTATWFIHSGTFNEWKSTPSFLWIHGKRTPSSLPLRIRQSYASVLIAGSGKSILCSVIIEDIIALRKAGFASMAYFYCDFRDEHKQSRRNIVLSILSQLSTQSNLYCDILSHLYSALEDGTQKPSDGALMLCLKEMLSLADQHPVYLIVDAIDECPNNSGMPTRREEVLDVVKSLISCHFQNLRVCITSRLEIDIQDTFKSLTPLHISLHDQTGQKKDIIDYINSVVYSDSKMRRWREEDKRLVVEALSQRADGMFRWVYCQLETLRHCLPPSILGTLENLPETLDDTYERVLRDINKANQEHAHRLLQCLTVAVRPLHVDELAEVLAVDFDAACQGGGRLKLNPGWRWADQQQAVLSACSSLISIFNYGSSQLVQFSHFSVKEFLTSDRLARSNGDVSHYHILLEPAHTILAQACLAVLLRLEGRVSWDNAVNIPLAAYAARYWVEHAQFGNVSLRVQAAMEYLFDVEKPYYAAWLRIHDIDEFWSRFTPDRSLPRAEPLYYAATCGFYNLVKHLAAKHPEHINAEGGQKVTPLVAALYGKHFHVAEFLCQHGADVHVRGNWERTLLHAASLEDLVDVVEWLLHHGADVDARQDGCWTPLHLATFLGSLDVVRVLVENNADPNSPSETGEVSLHLAASPRKHSDQVDIMRLLLDHGADPNAQDNEGSTPLHHSSYGRGDDPILSIPGTIEGIRLLLEHGANIDAKNNRGETPLQVALVKGHHQVVESLLGHDAS